MPKILARAALIRPGRKSTGRRRKLRDERLAAFAASAPGDGLEAPLAGIGHNQGPALADDLLWGGEEIARFIFGDPNRAKDVYYYVGKVPAARRIPSFRIGSLVCARRSTIMRWIEAQEASGVPSDE